MFHLVKFKQLTEKCPPAHSVDSVAPGPAARDRAAVAVGLPLSFSVFSAFLGVLCVNVLAFLCVLCASAVIFRCCLTARNSRLPNTIWHHDARAHHSDWAFRTGIKQTSHPTCKARRTSSRRRPPAVAHMTLRKPGC